MIKSNFECRRGYYTLLISTIVDTEDWLLQYKGYYTLLISTIVDLHRERPCFQGYYTLLISTIVDQTCF